MIFPKFLKPGDTVSIISPSGKVEKENIVFAIKILESWGLQCKVSPNALGSYFTFSGTDAERLNDLQWALNDPDTHAIFCTRGGYGLTRIIQHLDFNTFLKNPKWVVGFSDITVLHACLNNQLQVASIHGPVLNSFIGFTNDDLSITYLKSMLFGETVTYEIPQIQKSHFVTEGTLIGGNLSILYALRGTPYDFDSKDKILFIEDVGEYPYHIDRMISNFTLGNKFESLQGIICGGFTDLKEQSPSFFKNAIEIIESTIEEYTYPKVYRFPAGHQKPNYPLILGARIEISEINKRTLIKTNL